MIGIVYKDSFIEAKNVTTTKNFFNVNNFNVKTTNITFSGEVDGKATINSVNFQIKNKENDQDIMCFIGNGLDYTSKEELKFDEGIVIGDINFSKYSSLPIIVNSIKSLLFQLLSMLVFVIVLYLIIKLFNHKFLEKFSNISIKKLLLSLGIGLAILICIPLLFILLFILKITAVLGFILLLIYLLLIILSIPIFIISLSEFFKSKLNNKLFNSLVCLICISIIFSIINLIPYVGSIFTLLILATGMRKYFNYFKEKESIKNKNTINKKTSF